MDAQRTLVDRLYGRYGDVEARVSTLVESAVGSDYFARLFATSVTNAMALVGKAERGLDRGVRVTRLAGRNDVTDITRQLARTEDKLEQVLQLVETLQARLDAVSAPLAAASPAAKAAAVQPQGVVPRPAKRAVSGAPHTPAPARHAGSGKRPAATVKRPPVAKGRRPS